MLFGLNKVVKGELYPKKKKRCKKRGLNSCYDTLLDVLHMVSWSGLD
jgi:hypothetical protein